MAVDTLFSKVRALIQGGSLTNAALSSGEVTPEQRGLSSVAVTPTATFGSDHIDLTGKQFSAQVLGWTFIKPKSFGVEFAGAIEAVIEPNATWPDDALLLRIGDVSVSIDSPGVLRVSSPGATSTSPAVTTNITVGLATRLHFAVAFNQPDFVQSSATASGWLHIKRNNGPVIKTAINTLRALNDNKTLLIGSSEATFVPVPANPAEFSATLSTVQLGYAQAGAGQNQTITTPVLGTTNVGTPFMETAYNDTGSNWATLTLTPTNGSGTAIGAALTTSIPNFNGLTASGAISVLCQQIAAQVPGASFAVTAYSYQGSGTILGASFDNYQANVTLSLPVPAAGVVWVANYVIRNDGLPDNSFASGPFSQAASTSPGAALVYGSPGRRNSLSGSGGMFASGAGLPTIQRLVITKNTSVAHRVDLTANLVFNQGRSVVANNISVGGSFQTSIAAIIDTMATVVGTSPAAGQLVLTMTTKWNTSIIPLLSVSGLRTEPYASSSGVNKLYGLRITELDDRTDDAGDFEFAELPWPTTSIPGGGGGGGTIDPSTLLLLRFDGVATDGGSNTYADSSQYNRVVTGGIQTNTGDPSGLTGPALSGAFGRHIYQTAAQRHASLASEIVVTGNWTMEWWFFTPELAANFYVNATTSLQIGRVVHNTGTLLSNEVGTNDQVFAETYSTNNSWCHFAIVQNGSAITLYINGVNVSTATGTYSLGLKNIFSYAGGQDAATPNVAMEELRVSNVARYTANFTPPTAPFTVSVQPAASGSPIWDVDANTNDTITTSGRGVTHSLNSSGWTVTEWSATSGLWYFETHLGIYASAGVTSDVGPGSAGVSSSPAVAVFNYGTGAYDVYSNSVQLAGFSASNNSPAITDEFAWAANTVPVIGVLLNASTRMARFYYDNGSGVQQTAEFSVPGSGPIFGVASSDATTGASAYLNGGQDAFTYPLPSGASAIIDLPTSGIPTNAIYYYPFENGNTAPIANSGSISAHTLVAVTNVGGGTLPNVVAAPGGGYAMRVYDGNTVISNGGSNQGFTPITGDFTMESWIYRDVATQAYYALFSMDGVYTGVYGDSGQLFAYNTNIGIYGLSGTQVMASQTWEHFAIVRAGGTLRGYLNGVLLQNEATSFGTGSIGSTLAGPVIGGDGMFSNESMPGYFDDFIVTVGAKYTANFTPAARGSAFTSTGGGSDVQAAGYNDIDAITGTGTFNTQANFPDAYFSSNVVLDLVTATGDAYVVDNDSVNFSGSGTLAATTCTGTFIRAVPINFSGSGTLDEAVQTAGFYSGLPLDWSGSSDLEDVSQLAVFSFLAPVEFLGDATLDDAATSLSAFALIDPIVFTLNAAVPTATLEARATQFLVNAVVPAATLRARALRYFGPSVDAEVPAATLTARMGITLDRSVPMATLQAAGTVVNTLRLDSELPRTTIAASALAGRLFSLSEAVPAVTLSAWTGWQIDVSVPAATGSSFVVSGEALRLNQVVPAATAQIGASSINVLTLAGSVPAAQRGNWGALAMAVPAARMLANISPVVGITRVAYSFTMANSAMTRYPAYPFIQVLRMGNTFYGVAEDGLHELGGTTDNTVAIPWAWETCMSDFGQAEKKTVMSAYLGGYVPTDMTYTIRAGDVPTGTNAHTTTATAVLRNHRQKFGIGRKSRFFAFGLAAAGGQVAIEGIEFEVATMSRRI